jgi:hypothetical protein
VEREQIGLVAVPQRARRRLATPIVRANRRDGSGGGKKLERALERVAPIAFAEWPVKKGLFKVARL